jgi:hypothetical protein
MQSDEYDGAPVDGSAWEGTYDEGGPPERVVRGGDWTEPAKYCVSAHRSYHLSWLPANTGIRLAATWRPAVGSERPAPASPKAEAPSARAAAPTHARAPSPSGAQSPSAAQDDLELKHDWRIEEGENGAVNYISRHHAPPPFSYNEQLEATGNPSNLFHLRFHRQRVDQRYWDHCGETVCTCYRS